MSTPKNNKIWIIAGEESGDIYGARLATELRSLAPNLIIEGMGGQQMKKAGVTIVVDSAEMGVVGLVEVIKRLPMFYRVFHGLVRRASQEQPRVVVLIDYPGFNLRFAREMKRLQIPVVYYISPQVWAWGRRRIPEIARLVARMLVIFPFEKKIYDQVGLDTRFVGHPLVEIAKDQIDPTVKRDANLVLLLPGSRASEVDRLLVPIIRTAQRLYRENQSLRFAMALPRPAIQARVERIIAKLPSIDIPLTIRSGETELWMQRATAGIAASGTVTVQSAIMGLPLVVVYRVHPFTYFLGRILVKVPYITMVNLIAGETVFEEFLQGQVHPDFLAPAVKRILPGGERAEATLTKMQTTVQRLSAKDNASRTAAGLIVESI